MFVPPVRKEQRRDGNGREQHSKRHNHPGVWVRRRFHGATLLRVCAKTSAGQEAYFQKTTLTPCLRRSRRGRQVTLPRPTGVLDSRRLAGVMAAILPPRMATLNVEVMANPTRHHVVFASYTTMRAVPTGWRTPNWCIVSEASCRTTRGSLSATG